MMLAFLCTEGKQQFTTVMSMSWFEINYLARHISELNSRAAEKVRGE